MAIFCNTKAVALPFICRRGSAAECVDILSSNRDLSDWTPNSNVTLGGSITAVDDTTLTSNGLIPDISEGSNFFIAKIPVIPSDDTLYTYKFYGHKGAGSDWIYARFQVQDGDWAWAYFDLDTGAVGTVGGSADSISTSIASAANGWFLCSITANSATGASEFLTFFCADGDGDLLITTGDDSTVWCYVDLVELCA